MKISQFQSSTVDAARWPCSPRERRPKVAGRIKPLMRKYVRFIIESNEGELTASGEIGFREDALREQMAASGVSPVCIDIAVLTVQKALEAGLAGLEASSDDGTIKLSEEQLRLQEQDLDYVFSNGSTDLRLGPLRVIIAGTEDKTLDYYNYGQRFDDMPLDLVIALTAQQIAREAGLVEMEGDGLNLAPTDDYSDVDGTVDIRVGPLHVIIIWREDDTGIEN